MTTRHQREKLAPAHKFAHVCALLLAFSTSTQGADATGWEKVSLSANTRCADGSPFSMFLNRGTTDRVVVDFMGGGACWDAATCHPNAINYTKSVPDVIGKWIPEASGIYDRSRVDNPFRNDTHILIPYCTGDVHWGDADRTYQGEEGVPYIVHHRGAVNAQTALDTFFTNKTNPVNDIVVTGCSAGAYASIWWTPYIKRLAGKARIIQFSDSGAGVLTEEFRRQGMRNWQIESSAPRWIPGLDPAETDLYQLSLDRMYSAIATAHPDIQFSQFNTQNDVLQRWFFRLMGGSLYSWNRFMRESVTSAAERNSNFNYFIAPWDAHCILPDEAFFAKTTDAPHGVAFHDWITRLIDGSRPGNEPCDGCYLDQP